MSRKITVITSATYSRSNFVYRFDWVGGGAFQEANFRADLAPDGADLVGDTHAVTKFSVTAMDRRKFHDSSIKL